jgi:hypothetical protein
VIVNRKSALAKTGVLLRAWIISATIGLVLAIPNDCSGSWPIWNLSAQEYIVVRVKDQPEARVPVLLNGVRSGTTGELITLGSPGQIYVSVELPKAKQRSVNVKHTTPSQPQMVEIDCR